MKIILVKELEKVSRPLRRCERFRARVRRIRKDAGGKPMAEGTGGPTPCIRGNQQLDRWGFGIVRAWDTRLGGCQG